MNTLSATEKAASVFANHPGVDTLFLTSDQMAFFDFAAANDHASNVIGDKAVTTVTRSEIGQPVIAPAPEKSELEEAEDKVTTLKSNLVSKQEAFDAEENEEKLEQLENEIKQLGFDLEEAEKLLEGLKA